MVGERGFEPPAPASRRQCSTRLSYSPTDHPPLKQGARQERAYSQASAGWQAGNCLFIVHPMASAAIPSSQTRQPHWEWQYLDLMRQIWEQGDERIDRTGIGTRSVFGTQIRFDLSGGAMPLLTTKRVYWKTAAREFLWFLTGATNIRPLVLQGVKIWNEWPHAAYVKATGDAISLEAFVDRIAADEDFARQWGDLGPVYGKQWVDWPVYVPTGEGLYKRDIGINQVAQVVESLRGNPGSRRHIVEGWNVAELDQMALPPCHKTYQFHVSSNGRLNCALYQRSCDVALGLPFNLFGAALFTRLLAQQCDLDPGELVWMGGDTHLYLNQTELVEAQLQRTPHGAPPRLVLARRPDSIFDYRIEDFEMADYAPQAALTAPVAV
jgi:thymidylate synthase